MIISRSIHVAANGIILFFLWLSIPLCIPKQGQPLHIRVTPDHENSTATLEITSPTAEEFFSSTTVIPTLGNQKPRITIIPSPNVLSQKQKGADATLGPERAMSPVTITTFSREKTPEGGRGAFADRPTSPIQIMTVSTSAAPTDINVPPESQEMPVGRTVLKVTPEKQPGPTPVRKYNANANIITTEDNKIHIHLGSQFKRGPGTSAEGASPVITVRPVNVGVLCLWRGPEGPAWPPGRHSWSQNLETPAWRYHLCT